MTGMKIIRATAKEASVLVELVNSGYRGEASKKGWTTEAELLDGTSRIDVPSLKAMINSPESVLLKAESDDGNLVGCVYLQKQERGLYLGLLTVSPLLQAGGIGKHLLSAAEAFARDHHCPTIFMTVISRRSELIAWYERHGYRKTDEKKPFPDDNKFGIPTVPLEFVILEKEIL